MDTPRERLNFRHDVPGRNKFSGMMIIVSGLPGSGKSYFASRLAARIGAQYLSSDLTRKQMDAMGQYAFGDKLKVYEEMARRAGNLLRQGETVVVDATFYQNTMRNLFLTLARLLHQKVCYFEIIADEALAKERLRQPRLHSEADISVYELLKPQYELLQTDHLTLESQDGNIDTMLAEGVDYIKKLNAERGNSSGL